MGRVSERADARANRQRLVAAAREVFAERGIEADVKEICERSGVGVATFYRNFATKDELVTAIIDEVLGEVGEIVDLAESETGAEAAIDAMITGALAFVERHQELARALRASGAERVLLPRVMFDHTGTRTLDEYSLDRIAAEAGAAVALAGEPDEVVRYVRALSRDE